MSNLDVKYMDFGYRGNNNIFHDEKEDNKLKYENKT